MFIIYIVYAYCMYCMYYTVPDACMDYEEQADTVEKKLARWWKRPYGGGALR